MCQVIVKKAPKCGKLLFRPKMLWNKAKWGQFWKIYFQNWGLDYLEKAAGREMTENTRKHIQVGIM